MKKFKVALIALVIGVSCSQVVAQSLAWERFIMPFRKSPWILGLGWNIVEDNGNAWKKIFAAKSSWHMPYFPASLTIEKMYTKGWSFVAPINLNIYKPGKLVNSDIPSTASYMFISSDLNARYDFNQLYDFNKLIDPAKIFFDYYGTFGSGYTYRSAPRVKSAATLNLGFGANIWIAQGFGINLQSMAKFGMASPFFSTPKNYLHYTFGAVYKFIPKGANQAKRYKFNKTL